MNTIQHINKEVKNVNTDPSEKQKVAGNYKMGHVVVKGMKITIENPKGSYRSGKNRNGSSWKTKMKHHYGYFTLTKGYDGDAVDVFIGPKCQSFKNVYIIDQNGPNGEFDESKVMLGFNGIKSAKNAYLSNYNNKTQKRMIRSISCVSIDDFKKWLYRKKKQRKPFSEYESMKNKLIKEEIDQEYINRGSDFDVLEFQRVVSKKTGKQNLRNKQTGNLLLKTSLDKVYNFINGAAIVFNDGEYNFVDKDGDFVSSEWFDDVDEFKENGLATVFKDFGNKTLYNKIDLNGNIQEDWGEI